MPTRKRSPDAPPAPPPRPPAEADAGGCFACGCFMPFVLSMLVVAAAWGSFLGAGLKIFNDAEGLITQLESFRPKTGSKVYSSDGVLLGEFTIEQRQLRPLSEIPLQVQKAIIATEDHLFYEHHGVRFDAYPKIVYDYLTRGGVRGGSGLTQQVVRNVEPLAIGREVSPLRKLREAIAALQVERRFTKDEILELYLNQVFLGISAYGVEAAAQQYFGKPISDVTLGEAATIAGLLRSPNANEPINNLGNALARRNIVLSQMLAEGFITPEQHVAALQEDLFASVSARKRTAAHYAKRRSTGPWLAPYFVEDVRRQVLAELGKEAVFTEGLEIRTSLDMELQTAAEEVLNGALADFDAKKFEALKRAGKVADFVPVSGALVCIDNRPGQEGLVRALVGGRDFQVDQYSTATQARRQPGSSIKPFVWAAAIDSGRTPSTIVMDTPYTALAGNGTVWAPKNFDGKFHGAIPIRHALERSVNIVSIRLTKELGMPLIRSYLQSCGIRSPIDDMVGLTIALGTPEVTVLEHASAYATFARLGVYAAPVMLAEIYDQDSVRQYDYRVRQEKRQAIPANVAYVVTHMLEGVCTPGNGFYPTGHRTSRLERPRAGKTGTTNNSRNVWFCGYTPQFTCVVWVGYRDNRPLGAGADYTGGRLACPIWTDFMIRAHEDLPIEDFPVPQGVEFYNIDRFTGVAGGNYREAYIAGTRPPAAAPRPIDDDNSLLLGASAAGGEVPEF